MGYNHAPLLRSLVTPAASTSASTSAHVLSTERSDPTLLQALPSLNQLRTEAGHLADWEYEKQREDARKELELQEALAGNALQPAPLPSVEPEQRKWSLLDAIGSKAAGAGGGKGKTEAGGPAKYHSSDVFRAIDSKEIMTLMAIRDTQFDLLLHKPPGASSVFPIVYSMRCGPKWSETTILLVGVLSRFVNHLDSDAEPSAAEKNMLKSLRVNLKAAIDFGLSSSQTELISSYLQVLIMSEGESFIHKTLADLTLALRSGPPARPVRQAREAVTKFMTKDLRGAQGLAAVEDYIANATADLLLLGLYTLLSPTGEVLPLYAFARDLRMLGLFVEARAELAASGAGAARPARFKRLAQVFVEKIENSKKSFKTRVAELEEAIDGERGLK